MSKPISWKKAGFIVILLHAGAFAGLIGINQIKSKIHRAQREKEQIIVRDTKDMWPEVKGKKVLTYPKNISKKITDTASNTSFQDYIADKSSWLLVKAVQAKEGFVDTYKDLEKTYNSTTDSLNKAQEQIAKKVEKKAMAKLKPIAPSPTPKPVQVSKPKPKADTRVVYQRVVTREAGKTATREDFLETQEIPSRIYNEPLPPVTHPTVTTRTIPISNNEPEYSTMRYSYERAIRDPRTGEVIRRERVVGPAPIAVY